MKGISEHSVVQVSLKGMLIFHYVKSVQIRGNTDQINSVFGNVSRSVLKAK